MTRLAAWWRASWPAMASGLLCALAFPPANISLLVVIGLVPWLAWLRDTDGRGALRSGYLFGLVFMGYQMYWLFPFVAGWTNSVALGLVPWLLSAAIGALYFVAAGWLMHRCYLLDKPWLIPLAWAAVEAFRSVVPHLAFPWGLLANPLWPYPALIQHAALGTIFLVSAWLVVPNVLLAEWFWPDKSGRSEKRPLAPTYRMVALFAALLLISGFRYYQRPETEPYVVSVGQPAVDKLSATVDEQAVMAEDASALIMGLASLHNSELLVLPEGFAVGGPEVPPENPLPNPDRPDMSVLLGGNKVQGEAVYQTAYLYDNEQDAWTYLNKTRLVIFGEYVPLRDRLGFLESFRLPSGDLTPGEELGLLTVDGVRIAPMICFEALFADIGARQQALGPDMIAVMSIDDWYQGTPAPEQLMSASVWRAVESGLPLVRSANSGITMAVDHRGHVLSSLPEGQTDVMRVEVGIPINPDAIPQRYAFVYLCWAGAAWICIETVWKRRKERLARKPAGD